MRFQIECELHCLVGRLLCFCRSIAALPKAETKQQLSDWWDSFDSRYMRPYFSRPEGDSPSAAQGLFPRELSNQVLNYVAYNHFNKLSFRGTAVIPNAFLD